MSSQPLTTSLHPGFYHPSTGEDEHVAQIKRVYGEFIHAKCYEVVDVILKGTAQEFITKDVVLGKLRLALKRELGRFPICEKHKEPGNLGIFCFVLTHGSSSPIAVYSQLYTSWARGQGLGLFLQYGASCIGIESEQSLLSGAIDKYINPLARIFSYEFFTARDELVWRMQQEKT